MTKNIEVGNRTFCIKGWTVADKLAYLDYKTNVKPEQNTLRNLSRTLVLPKLDEPNVYITDEEIKRLLLEIRELSIPNIKEDVVYKCLECGTIYTQEVSYFKNIVSEYKESDEILVSEYKIVLKSNIELDKELDRIELQLGNITSNELMKYYQFIVAIKSITVDNEIIIPEESDYNSIDMFIRDLPIGVFKPIFKEYLETAYSVDVYFKSVCDVKECDLYNEVIDVKVDVLEDFFTCFTDIEE